MDKVTRVGVIGVGYLGRIHAKIYQRMSNVELVGVLDTDESSARQVAEENNCKTFTHINELMNEVDAVSIVTPTVTHSEIAQPFIKNGIHILVEKPIAENYENSLQLVQMAEEAGIIFQVGFLERFNAGVMALAEQVHNPRFIESHRLSPFVERATDVDVITDLMIHDIDIILSLVKSDIVNISGSGLKVLTDHIDIANVRLEFANGAVANVTASRVSNKKYRQMRVFEKNQYFSLNFEDQQLSITHTEPQPGDSRDKIVTQHPEIKHRLPLDTELAAFIDSVNSGETPLVDGRTGLEAIRVANLVCNNILDNTA